MRLKIRRPDDMHVHLRGGGMLQAVLPYTAQCFGRAVVMPNVPPITSGQRLGEYRGEIVQALAPLGDTGFQPLMTLMLDHRATSDTVREAHAAGATACKIYPANVTTGSEQGVTDFGKLGHLYETMQELDMVLCWHGELPGQFCLDREPAMLHEIRKVVDDFPRLRMVLEHITTRQSVHWVERAPDTVAATITVHHMFLTLDDVLGGGEVGTQGKLYPDHYCAPIPKRREDREELLRAATSGNPKFFLGTDSAPHRRAAKLGGDQYLMAVAGGFAEEPKELPCCGAGVFSAPVAMAALAHLFNLVDRVDALEGFASEYGARFYGLPLNEGFIELEQAEWTVPWVLDTAVGGLAPFLAGKPLSWRLV